MRFKKWHPERPTITSVSNGGLVHIWSIVTQERWGAFAAEFEELDENVIYEEKEDEFDIVRVHTSAPLRSTCDKSVCMLGVQEDEEVLRQRKAREEDADVDIISYDDEFLEASRSRANPGKADIANDIDLAWVHENPDDDDKPYFPPVYPEPPDVAGY